MPIYEEKKSGKHECGRPMQGPKNFRILTRPPAILHLSYSQTKKDNPLALTKFFLVRTSGLVDSLDSAMDRVQI